jgi:hypothetical protein
VPPGGGGRRAHAPGASAPRRGPRSESLRADRLPGGAVGGRKVAQHFLQNVEKTY